MIGVDVSGLTDSIFSMVEKFSLYISFPVIMSVIYSLFRLGNRGVPYISFQNFSVSSLLGLSCGISFLFFFLIPFCISFLLLFILMDSFLLFILFFWYMSFLNCINAIFSLAFDKTFLLFPRIFNICLNLE